MSKTIDISQARILEGAWECWIEGEIAEELPSFEILYQGNPIEGVELSTDESGTRLRAPIPLMALSDGVQTFIVTDTDRAQTYGHFSILAGNALDLDLRAELDLLRAELDMLSKAFRRHCAEVPAEQEAEE